MRNGVSNPLSPLSIGPTGPTASAVGDDGSPTHHTVVPQAKDYTSEEATASVLSRSVFAWVTPLFLRGWRRSRNCDWLQVDDLLELPDAEDPKHIHAMFVPCWEQEVERARDRNKEPNILTALFTAYHSDFLMATVLRLGNLSALAMPFFLRYLVEWMNDLADPTVETSVWVGFVWAVAIPVTAFTANVFMNLHAHYALRGFCRMRTACVVATFEKALGLWSDHGLNGLVTQMHSSDNFKFFEVYGLFSWMWIAPLQIVASLICLYFFIGWAGVISILVMVVGVPMQSYFLSNVATLQRVVAACADGRQGLLREVMRGMRVIKFMDLVEPMTKRTSAVREEEEACYDSIYRWKAAIDVLGNGMPVVVTFVVFIAAWQLGDPVTPSSLFSTMVMLQMMRLPIVAMTQAISKFNELHVSSSRIQAFLLFDDRGGSDASPQQPPERPLLASDDGQNPSSPQQEPSVTLGATTSVLASTTLMSPSLITAHFAEEDPQLATTTTTTSSATADVVASNNRHVAQQPPTDAVVLEDVTVLRDEGSEYVKAMEKLNLRIPRDVLTVVYGSTGSGKSLLLKVILQEVRLYEDSRVYAPSPVAYASQEPFLQHGTIRDNVTFSAPYDAERFDSVASSSQLGSELENLQDGDMTELLDRGSNLSGGQRQRIAIARAAYSTSPLVLLDDCLSALDPRVSEKVFTECIQGTMAGRTRILVTHQAHLLPQAAHIVLMDRMGVAFSGSFADLRQEHDIILQMFHPDTRVALFGERYRQRSVVEPFPSARMRMNSQTTRSGALSLKQFVSSAKFRVAAQFSNLSAKRFSSMVRKENPLDSFRERNSCSYADIAAIRSNLQSTFRTQPDHLAPPATDDIGPSLTLLDFPDETYVETTDNSPAGSPLLLGATTMVRRMSSRCFSSSAQDLSQPDSALTNMANSFQWFLKNHTLRMVVATILLALLHRGANIITDLMLSYWATRTELFSYTPDDAGYACWYAGGVVATLVLLILRQITFAWGASAAVRKTHSSMFDGILHVPMSFFDLNPLGAIASRFARDLECVDGNILENLNMLYYGLALVLGSCGLMCFAAPYLAAVVVCIACLYVAILKFYQTTTQPLRLLEAAARAPMVSMIGEVLNGLEVIRSYRIADEFRMKHLAAYRHSAKALYNVAFARIWFNQQLGTINSIVVLAVTLMATGLMASYDHGKRRDQLAQLSLAVTYVVSLSQTLTFLVNLVAELENSLTSIDRVAEFATRLPCEQNKQHRSGGDDSGSAINVLAATHPPTGWPTEGSIEFRNVSLRYSAALPLALNKLSFRIHPGEHVGVVGRTGSGKSTLVQALFRLVDLVSGSVWIDGVDAATMRVEALRTSMTIVPQDPMLFEGTVRFNVDPLSCCTDEDVENALRRVKLYCPNTLNLDSKIEEGGSNLSSGQRQLLCLARAMVRKCRILVMDEATANVDATTDALIQHIVEMEFASLTTITIAHRLATIIDCDRILVMDSGSLVEYDTPSKLLSDTKSTFFQIAESLGAEQLNELKARARMEKHAKKRRSAAMPRASFAQDA